MGVPGGATELESVRSRVARYDAVVASEAAIESAFSAAWTALESAFEWKSDETPAAIEAALRAPALISAYASVLACVEVFVATELDTATPGERGLGRMSAFPPRLGGAFRRELSPPESRAAFGPIIEAMIRDSYAGTAAISAGAVKPVAMPAEGAFSAWVPRAYVGTRNMSDLGIDFIACCSSETEVLLFQEAQARGLLGGLRRKRREEILGASAGFWIAAGAALFRTASDHPD